MMRKPVAILTVLAGCLAAGGCITDPVTGESVVGMPTSDAEEAAMGREYRPLIVQEFDGPYPDQEVQDHLGRIVLGMAERSVRPDLPWTFTVLNTSVPNAFAVPGGQVFVTRGLLTELEDEAEFAVVMGHELGHVEHRHSVQQQGQQLLFGAGIAVAQAAAGDSWTPAVEQGAGLLAALGMSKYSRDDERESDARGVENSYRAGYDPREGADVFRTFLRLKAESGGGGGPDWLSSHPADEERIETILRLSAEKDPRLARGGPVEDLRITTPEWAPLIARIRETQKVYDRHDAAISKVAEADGSVESVRAVLPDLRRCAADLPGHALLASTLGKALLITGDEAGARRELERAASLGQDLLEPEYLLGELALDAQDWSAAAEHAERGLAILPGNYPCLWIRGESSWNTGRRDAAQQDFQLVLQSAPEDSAQYRGAAGRMGLPARGTTEPRRAVRRRRAR